MAEEVRIWEIGAGDGLVEIEGSKLNLEERIEKWLTQDISILSSDLLVIGEQVKTAFGKFIDLLCIDPSGNLVIVELKRDMTPREVTAQVLDYASWVKDLGAEEIEKIATTYFKGQCDLQRAFREKFNEDLPEVINEGHSMRILASEIDASTERIIRYLSETYAVDINAVHFQFYEAADHRQLLVRTFTLTPEEVETATGKRSRGKRTNATAEQMMDAASAAGVGELYQNSVQVIGRFLRIGFTKAACVFGARFSYGARKTICSLAPADSSAEKGLLFTIYSKRLAEHLGVDEAMILDHLPSARRPFEPWHGASAEFQGWAAYIKSREDIEKISSLFPEVIEEDRSYQVLPTSHSPSGRYI